MSIDGFSTWSNEKFQITEIIKELHLYVFNVKLNIIEYYHSIDYNKTDVSYSDVQIYETPLLFR